MNLGPQMASITGKLQSNFPETEQKKKQQTKTKTPLDSPNCEILHEMKSEQAVVLYLCSAQRI